MLRSTFVTPIPEGSTRFIQARLLDKDDKPLLVASVNSITLVLYNLDEERTVLNTRGATPILNQNGGTLDATGLFTLELNPWDNMLLDHSLMYEVHRALITWTYHTNKIGRHEVEFTVQNLARIPSDTGVWR